MEENQEVTSAARRFKVGISTAIKWHRRYRETCEATPRKRGQPSRSRLDPHEGFILGLIDDQPDITLTEIGERLAEEHDVHVVASTIWYFLDKRGVTFKKRRRTPPSNSVQTS